MPDRERPPTRERLLTSGAALFAEKGYAGVSVREICRHAGTSANMIHHYFDSKAGLLAAIVEQFGVQVFAVPMRLLEAPVASAEELRSRLGLLFEVTVEACIEQRALMMVVTRERADPPALVEYMTRFAEFLDRARGQGLVREGLDATMVTGALLDRIMNQVRFAPWIKRNYGTDLSDPDYRRRWCASNLDLFLYGMVPREAEVAV